MASWHFCNVLDAGADTRRVWQFDARGEPFNLSRELTARNGEQLPAKLVGKKAGGAIFEAFKLNVAWLPSGKRVPPRGAVSMSWPEETRSMVELQLEKLSPIPVTQALWTMQVLPKAAGGAENLQTIIVIVVARNVVEEFLGKLEGQGYMADRLELPMLDQLQATQITGDGAWVYPETHGAHASALVAWWYGGVFQNLGLLTLESGPNRIASLKDQVVQMTWAGELEGWLTAPPRWYLVGDAGDAWHATLREALEQPVEIVAPVPAQQLAAMTARRAANMDSSSNLLPPEFATRYQQQFVDRLWGRGLLAALGIYAVGLAIYFVALTVFSQLTSRVERQADGISNTFTNSIQMTDMLAKLKERDELKFAALDCWKAVAETMPTGLTLDTLNFNGGKSLSLRGTAPTDQVTTVTDFWDALRKWKKSGQPFFDDTADVPRTSLNPGATTINWSFELDLKRTEK